MKKIVAKAVVAAVAAILVSTTCFAQDDSSAVLQPLASNTALQPLASNDAASASEPQPVERIATRFEGQGAWVATGSVGGKDAVEAAQRATVILAILGMAAIAIVARMRLRAEEEALRAKETIRR
jgi:hypothetical protein